MQLVEPQTFSSVNTKISLLFPKELTIPNFSVLPNILWSHALRSYKWLQHKFRFKYLATVQASMDLTAKK